MFLCQGFTDPCARRYATCRYVVGVERFELSTFRSQAGCSAQTELRPDNGVTDGSRTRDLRLGKPMFFLLNYCHKMVLQTGLEPVLYGLSFRFLYRDWDTGAHGVTDGV